VIDSHGKLVERGYDTMGNYQSDQKNTKKFTLKLSRNTDKDIINKLEQQVNIQGYLKRLIREDIEKTGK